MPEFAVEEPQDDTADNADLSEKTGSNPCGTPFDKSVKCNCQNCQMDMTNLSDLYQI